ncbi:OpgC protein [mine drainage metagenome]|uniref:OpgC protein n=1 Tax=mine drainage metagenome TaxID=410659 RepID=A0A1J5STW3_9ZZZZ
MNAAVPVPAKRRDIRFDALRGLLLIVMMGVHLPTPVSRVVQEPLGFFSSAEGFVFLAACLAGMIYGRTYDRDGWNGLTRKAYQRTGRVYGAHLALLLPIAMVAWTLAEWVPSLANHFHDFLLAPGASLALTPLLLNQPPLFDILPLYVVLLAATPVILWGARKLGWLQVIAISVVIWLAPQEGYGLNTLVNHHPLDGLRLGSFELLAWQLLWVGGMALGDTVGRGELRISWRTHRLLVAAAAAIAVSALLVRYGLWPRAFFSTNVYMYMNKWTLGPLRLLDLGAIVVLLLAFNPRPPQALLKPLASVGRNSLFVFCFHIPVVMVATTWIEGAELGQAARAIVGLAAIASLFVCAQWLDRNAKRREAALASDGRTALDALALRQRM